MENVKMTFHHIGIAVYSFEVSLSFYKSMGYHKEIEVYDPEQDVDVCVLRHESEPCIELLAPHDDKSPINNILKKRGASPYHICYQVKDMNKAIASLKKERFMVVSKPKISNAFDNHLVCFLMEKEIGLIELIKV